LRFRFGLAGFSEFNREGAGIPRREAMQITGHLTEAVYKRYAIEAEAGATEAGRKLREFEAYRKAFANKFANELPGRQSDTPNGDSDKYLN
jgi:hypothetical protein